MGSQLDGLRKCAQNLNFCRAFSTLPAVLRRAGLGQAIRVLHYGLIVLAAWAAATVVVRLAGLDLHPRVPAALVAADTAARSPKPGRIADEAIILKRNLFGAADIDVPASEDSTATATGGAAVELRLRGIATSEGANFAVFEDTSSGEQNVFAVGEKVFDGPKLVAVDPDGADVLLKGKKKRYQIQEDDDGSGDSGGKAGKGGGRHGKGEKGEKGAKSSKSDKGSKKDAASATSGVKKTGDGAYLVDRREVEQQIANLNEVITQARAVPVLADGKSNGFKLFNIKPGSIFDKVGLQDGDIVQRVNDTELSDPSKAVGLLEEIQSMSQIKVNFVRGGKLHSYNYTIR